MPIFTQAAVGFSVLVLLSSQCQAQSSLVYDNSGTEYSGVSAFTALWQGDEVRLAENANKVISQIDVGVTRQNQPGLATIQLRLYSNDGDQGAPGSLLWESLPKTNIPLSGGNELITFHVPNITVPDIFTWVAKFSNSTDVAAGLPVFGAATIGFSPDYSWFGEALPGQAWTKLTSSGFPPPFNVDDQFLARVHAVPAPMPILGVSAFLTFSRRLRKRIRQ